MRKLIETVVRKALVNSLLFLVSFAFAQPLFALEFECRAGTDKRFIRMELPGIDHLCEVSVTYSSKERKVMWYADNDSSFCTEKTDELQKKYESTWNFQCEQWPDHDGVDQLSKRQRIKLDAKLKTLIKEGQNELTPFMVEGLKAAASPASSNGEDVDLLAVQFFLHSPDTGFSRDVTHIFRDDGVSWNTLAKIDSLAQYIEVNGNYTIDSALISNVTSNGALEVITVLGSLESSSNNGSEIDFSGCYGNQILATGNDGELTAKTPHRYYCPKTTAADAG